MTILVIMIELASPRVAGADAAASGMSHEALVRGRRLEIKGRVTRDGSFEARRIRLRDPEEASKIEGRVLTIDATRRHAVIGSFGVSLSANPVVYRGEHGASLRDLSIGQVVEAKGYWSGHLLHAERLRIRETSASGEPAARDDNEIEIESEIERVDRDAGTLVVLGRAVRLGPDGKVVDERTQSDRTDWAGNRLRRDDDDQQVGPIQVGDWLTIGGRIGGDVRGERNFDHDPGEPEPDDSASASGELLALAAVGSNVELYARVRTTREFALDAAPTAPGELDLRVLEASVTIDNIAGSPVGLRVGRQRFRDAREWFFDEYLDAARVHVDLPSWRFEAAVASGLFAGPEPTRQRRDQRQAIVSLAKRLGERTTATAFAIARDDRNRRERPLWIGGSVAGRVTRALKYWANGAVRRGHADAITLRGWALDAALAYRLPLPAAPAISAGYAAGSGDQSRSDGVDSAFRQTGLEDNSARFHGLKRFGYYGVVFDPELSNLNIVTVGAGMKPIAEASIDVVYHGYTQRHHRQSLPSNALEASGTGRSAQLGREVDVIVSVQRFRPVDFSIVAGIFWPGAGVASPTRPSRYWRPEIRFFF